MNTRSAIVYIFFLVTFLSGHAEWRELKNDSGHVVEIVADFRIEDLVIDANGTTSFVAKAVVDGEQVGFSAALSRGRESTMPVMFQKKGVAIIQSDIDIRSIGPATAHLEERLNRRLLIAAGKGDALRVVGPHSAYCPLNAASIAEIALVKAFGVGFSYDARGNRISGECFSLQLIIDGPLEKVTVYFCKEGGYGGIAEADRARSNWSEAHQKKESPKITEPQTGVAARHEP